MPPPLDDLAIVAVGEPSLSRSHALYGLLRREQAIATAEPSSPRSEVSRALDFAQTREPRLGIVGRPFVVRHRVVGWADMVKHVESKLGEVAQG